MHINSLEENYVLASLATLAEFARAGSTGFELRASEIMETVAEKVMLHTFPAIEVGRKVTLMVCDHC